MIRQAAGSPTEALYSLSSAPRILASSGFHQVRAAGEQGHRLIYIAVLRTVNLRL